MSHTIQCTHCKTALKLKAPPGPGKKVVCPKCKETFVTPGEGPHTRSDTATALEVKPPGSARTRPSPAAPKEADEADEARGGNDEERRERYADDEDDETAELRVKKEKKRSKGAVLWLLILGGGFVAFLGCVGCGVGGYFAYVYMSGPNIRGVWEVTNLPMKETVEFRADGTGVIEDQFAVLQMKYTIRKEDPPIVEWEITRQDMKKALPFGLPVNMVGVRRQFRMTMRDDQNMTLSPINELIGRQLTLRRMQ